MRCFGSSKAGVNIWMCRCLYWVRLRWSWFRTAHLVLCPRFVTKTALTEENPPVLQLLLSSPSQSPGWLLPVSSHPQQHGWSGGCVGIRLGQLIHSNQRDSKPYHIVQGNKGRAAGWGGGDFTIQQMLRSWVGIGCWCQLMAFASFVYFFLLQLLHCLYISTIKFFLLLYFWLATWSHWEGMSKWLCGDWPGSQDQSSPLYHGLLNASWILFPVSSRP